MRADGRVDWCMALRKEGWCDVRCSNTSNDSAYLVRQTRHVLAPLTARFEFAFVNTFSRSKNAAFLQKVALRRAHA